MLPGRSTKRQGRKEYYRGQDDEEVIEAHVLDEPCSCQYPQGNRDDGHNGEAEFHSQQWDCVLWNIDAGERHDGFSKRSLSDVSNGPNMSNSAVENSPEKRRSRQEKETGGTLYMYELF